MAALRLASQCLDANGQLGQVIVLERGEEWLSGEFPDGLGKAFGQVRMRMPGSPHIQGNPQGLFEMRVGNGLAALVGNALGGSSQINANLLRKPEEAVFQRHRTGQDGRDAFLWPARWREPGALEPYYALARKMLGAQLQGAAFHGSRREDQVWRINGWGEPLKRQALRGCLHNQATIRRSSILASVSHTQASETRLSRS